MVKNTGYAKVNSAQQMSQENISARSVVINNTQGLHARPADLFVKQASQFEARIEIIKDGERVDGKSILGILTLGAGPGTELVIEATGIDAPAAVESLVELIEQKLREIEAQHQAQDEEYEE